MHLKSVDETNLEPLNEDTINYWTRKIDRIAERCDLNGLLKDKGRHGLAENQESQAFKRKEISLIIADHLLAELNDLCTKYVTSLHSILQFAWHKVLHVYGNGSQTVVATSDLVRNTIGSLQSLDNVLPVIVNHRKQRNQQIMHAVQDIEAKLNKPKDVNICQLNSDLFHSLSVLADGEISQSSTRFALTVIVSLNHEQGVKLGIAYDGELFADATVNRLLDIMKALLAGIASDEKLPVADLEYLSDKQKNQLSEWNNTDAEFPSTARLHHLFEEAVERTPDNVALVYEDTCLTYLELNGLANQLAYYLNSVIGINPEELIALFLDKSDLVIISLLGIWKSGAAYVPIDSAYPDERVQFTIDDTEAKVAIANQHHASRLGKLSSNHEF